MNIREITDSVVIAKKLVGDWNKEHCIGIYCNANQDVKHVEVITIGLLDSTLIHPREVFKPALLNNATHVIILHNHPSNNVMPSKPDKRMMKLLESAGRIMGIEVYDQIVFCNTGSFYSLREKRKCEL